MEPQGWEYKIDRHAVEVGQDLESIQDCLNDEGSDGWELVSVLQADAHDDVLEIMVFYKRPAARQPPARTISTEGVNELVDEAKDLLEKRRHEPP